MSKMKGDTYRWFTRNAADVWPPYGEQAMKERALIRDGYSCRECGMSQAEHKARLGRSLQVHHIHPKSQAKDPNRAHLLTNLVTLCERHHTYWESFPPLVQVDAFLGAHIRVPPSCVSNADVTRLLEMLQDYGHRAVDYDHQRSRNVLRRKERGDTR